MADRFSVDKKLELMQQIQSRYRRDRYDMFRREKIIYGHASPLRDESMDPMFEADEGGGFSTFPFRLLAAAAAAALLILSDRSGSSILGLSAEKCFQAISTDYESSIAAWADAAIEQTFSGSPVQP